MNKEGRVIQCNQGGWDFNFKESDDRTSMIFNLGVPRFMDTAFLNVEVEPTYVRCNIKEKITQLVWPEEVLCDQAKI
jgi:protein TilB